LICLAEQLNPITPIPYSRRVLTIGCVVITAG